MQQQHKILFDVRPLSDSGEQCCQGLLAVSESRCRCSYSSHAGNALLWLRAAVLTFAVPLTRFSFSLRLPSLRQCCRGPSISTFTERWTLSAITTCCPVQATNDKKKTCLSVTVNLKKKKKKETDFLLFCFSFSLPCDNCKTTSQCLAPSKERITELKSAGHLNNPLRGLLCFTSKPVLWALSTLKK